MYESNGDLLLFKTEWRTPHNKAEASDYSALLPEPIIGSHLCLDFSEDLLPQAQQFSNFEVHENPLSKRNVQGKSDHPIQRGPNNSYTLSGISCEPGTGLRIQQLLLDGGLSTTNFSPLYR